MVKNKAKKSLKYLTPCKYRNVVYFDIDDFDKSKIWRTDLKSQRLGIEWQNGYCRKVMIDKIIRSYLVFNDFDYLGQYLPEDVKILNPLHSLLLNIKKRIYTRYANLKIALTEGTDRGIVQKTLCYINNRFVNLERESKKKSCPINFSLRIEELKEFEKKFKQYVDEVREKL